MRQSSILFIFILFVFVHLFSCANVESQPSQPLSQAFKDYWYAGNAELTRYHLQQSRYGEMHEGDAVLIFVTEDFRSDKQVKYEGGDRKNVEPVLKLNFTKKFLTGIYPYSIMSSIFTPVDGGDTYKVSTSMQEWCGHSFSQLNLDGNNYKGKLYSYFQEEGDRKFEVDKVLLEDEIWTKIRLNPSSLPIGQTNIIPGTQFLRLKHIDCAPQKAVTSIAATQKPELSKKALQAYTVKYENVNRTLTIIFEEEFPHQIVQWTEEMETGTGSNKQSQITIATKTHQIKSAYWGQNSVRDTVVRKKLGLRH